MYVETLRITVHFFPGGTRAIVSKGPGGISSARVLTSRPLPGVDRTSAPSAVLQALLEAFPDPVAT